MSSETPARRLGPPVMALLLVPLAAALLGAPVGDDRHSESDGSLGLHVTQPLLQRGENLSAIATVSTTAAPGTTFVLTAELVDAAGRVMDRLEVRRTVTASSMAAAPLVARESLSSPSSSARSGC